MELGPVAGTGVHGFSLQAFVCFPMVPSALPAPWVHLVLN